MPEPRMPGEKGMNQEQKDTAWRLHTQHNLAAGVIGKRLRRSQSCVARYLKARRDAEGVTVEVKRFVFERPM